jgi:hypothetical protein
MSRKKLEDDIKNEPKESSEKDSSKCTECSQVKSQKLYGRLCDLCDEKFKSFGDIMNHKRAKHMANKESDTSTGNPMMEEHECFYYRKHLKSKQKMDIHSSTSHETFLSDFFCNVCKVRCKDRTALGVHKFDHHRPFAREPVPFF